MVYSLCKIQSDPLHCCGCLSVGCRNYGLGADILAGREENTGETVLLISGLVTEDILLMSSLLFCKDKVKVQRTCPDYLS